MDRLSGASTWDVPQYVVPRGTQADGGLTCSIGDRADTGTQKNPPPPSVVRGSDVPPPPGLADVWQPGHANSEPSKVVSTANGWRATGIAGPVPARNSQANYKADDTEVAAQLCGSMATCLRQAQQVEFDETRSVASRSTAVCSCGDATPDTSPNNGSDREVEEESLPKKNKKTRFCKAKRDRYRKLVERLVEEAKRSPDSFELDWDNARLPQALALNQASKERLKTTVAKFAAV